MPRSAQPRVFISYAHKDGAELARHLHADLENNFDTWLDTQRLTAGDIWSCEIEDAIDRASVVVALLSAGSYVSDICRAEQQRALEKGKCVIPIRVQSDCDIPLYLQTRQWLDFSNLKRYPEVLLRLIDSIHKQSGVAVSAELLVRYDNAPALPENFVNRPELLKALRDTLFTEGANRNIALTAMQGMGGIGKSVLAQALCRDEVVQQAFPDGIFWFGIGKESQLDFLARIKTVPGLDRLLGLYDGEAACLAQYRDVLRKKAALIVLDDVWRAPDIQPFIAESPRSRLLITTRDTSIGAWFGAREFTANLLTEAESRQVLAKWCGCAVSELQPQARDVIHECGRLPLALAMIGAQLRGKPPILWNSALDNLRRADLQKIKAQYPEPHTTLFRAIQVSVDALEEPARQRYLDLAVLLEEMAAAPHVQQCIWGVDETDAAETAEQFISLSLAQRDKPEGSIRLHDLQLDYVRGQWPREDTEALDLIHDAIRLSSNVIATDPTQFASQMVGRLLLHQHMSTISEFNKRVGDSAREPWLRPSHPTLNPAGTPLIRTLDGHLGWVRCVALSRDALRAVSASSDGTVRFWDLERGVEILRLKGHRSSEQCLAWSEDEHTAVASCEDYCLRVWDVDNARELRVLSGHSLPVERVALSGDARLVVSASTDQSLRVWNLGDGRMLHTLEGHSGRVWDVALSYDGRIAVSASADKTLKVWDLERGRLLRTLCGHSDIVFGVAVSEDGRMAVSASHDKTLKVWDVGDGQDLRTLEGHSDSVLRVALARDKQLVVSASMDGTLKVWDTDSGRELHTLSGHTGCVSDVAVSGDGRLAVSASEDRTLKVWNLERQSHVSTVMQHHDRVCCVAVGPDERTAVSVSYNATLKVWDVGGGRELFSLRGQPSVSYGYRVAIGGDFILSSFGENIVVWRLDGQELGTLTGHADIVLGLAVSGDGRVAVSASADKSLKVWDLETGCERHTLLGHSDAVTCLAVSQEGKLALSGSADGTLKAWDITRMQVRCTLRGHSDYVSDVALSSDGKCAISASRDGTERLWDVYSARDLYTLVGHTSVEHISSVVGVAIAPNGCLAATASSDKTVKVWDTRTGKLSATFTCDGLLACCAFVGNRGLIAGDRGGRLHFLHLEEPKAKCVTSRSLA